MTENQEDFISQIILSNTQGSSFQHACVYVEDIPEKNKPRFVSAFRGQLKLLDKRYSQEVSEEDHINNIIQFQTELSNEFSVVLRKGRMRLGVAQKAVNLYLKFLWCLGYINEPPHCPIDRTVLAKVMPSMNWTELDDPEDYKKIIGLIKKKAGSKSIAKWELDLWQKSH